MTEKKIYTEQQLNDAVDATVKRLIPFADAIVANMEMVAAGKRQRLSLDLSIEVWQESTKIWRE